MPNRVVATTLTANVGGYIGPISNAARATQEFAVKSKTALSGVSTSIGQVSTTGGWENISQMATSAGRTILGVLRSTADAAMSWQSDFAGVEKTVDGTRQQITSLEGDLRGMARGMASSHTEIAQVAENAGQLGIATDNVANFTRQMLMLGETTSLSADSAATSLAQLFNIMQTSGDKMGGVAATLVALGNSGASTETQIVGMAQRIAAAGSRLGMTEAQVMGYASALASVGVEVEAGGTAMSQTLVTLDGAVRGGGRSLELLAETAGMSASTFATAWRTDAASAMKDFIAGLGSAAAAGKDTDSVLLELGISAERQKDAIMRLAQAGGLLGSQLSVATGAMRDQNALINEYAVRASTAESQIAIAMNNIKDAAIDAGASLLPVLSDAAQAVVGVVNAYRDMDSVGKGWITGAAGVAAASLLVVGGGMKIITTVASVKESLATLGVSLGKGGVGISQWGRRLQRGAAAIATFGVALAAVGEVSRSGAASMDAVAEAVETLAKSGTGMEQLNAQMASLAKSNQWEDINDWTSAFKYLNDSIKDAGGATRGIQSAWDAALGWTGAKSATGQVIDEIGKIDSALAGVAKSGNVAGAQQAFSQFAAAAREGGMALGEMPQYFPEYKRFLENTAQALDVTGLSAEDYANWMGGKIPDSIKQATEGNGALVSGLDEQQRALLGVGDAAGEAASALSDYVAAVSSLIGGESAYKAALADTKKAIEETSDALIKKNQALNLDTEAGRKNMDTLLGQADGASKWLESMAEAGASAETLGAKASTLRADLQRAAEGFGMSREEAAAFAAQLISIPGEVAPTFSAPGAVLTKQQADAVKQAANAIPASKSVNILAPGARPSKAEVDEFMKTVGRLPAEKRTAIRTIAKLGGVEQAKSALGSIYDKTVRIHTVYSSSVSVDGTGAGKHSLKADGGIVEFYATGGVRENHIAEIAPAGTWRVWAEPETGGEAYIPLAAAKRPRSRQITEEVVGRLGGRVEWFAKGGFWQNGQWIQATSVLSKMVPEQPLRELAAAVKANTAAQRVQRANAVPRGTAQAKQRADAAHRAAVAQRDSIKARMAVTKSGTALYKRLQQQLKQANVRVTSTTKQKKASDDAYNKALSKAKDSTQKAAQAAKDLAAAQKALADAAAQTASKFKDPFAAVGGSVASWQSTMVEGAKTLAQFNAQLDRLRAKGLAEELVQLIAEQGPNGLVAELLGADASQIRALNAASKNLGKAADRLGLAVVAGKSYASGGIEPHYAQIATAGPRIWAEPETGGEAYIPLAAAKRGASIPIWMEAGRLLGVPGFAGGRLIPAGASRAAALPAPPPVSPEAIAAALTTVLARGLTIDLANSQIWYDQHAATREARRDMDVRNAGLPWR